MNKLWKAARRACGLSLLAVDSFIFQISCFHNRACVKQQFIPLLNNCKKWLVNIFEGQIEDRVLTLQTVEPPSQLVQLAVMVVSIAGPGRYVFTVVV